MTILFPIGIFYWKSYRDYVLKGCCGDLIVELNSEINW